MESTINAIFQIVVKSGQMFYRNKLLNFSKEQFDAFAKKLPSEWWHEKDQIVYFTYYDDESYFCEREKVFYDYSLKTETSKVYEFNVLPKETAEKVFLIFCDFFEEVRIEELKTQKEMIRQEIEQNFDFITIQFRSVRDGLLKASDWTQMPDVVASMDPYEASLWVIYRQYLRDLPNSDAWLNKRYIDIEFPFKPNEFIQNFPGEEYMSSKLHFVNEITLISKASFYEMVRTLTLPSICDKIRKLNHTELDFEAFHVLLDMTNEKLATIDPTLKIEINLTNHDLLTSEADGDF
jgi:hypothetical protein